MNNQKAVIFDINGTLWGISSPEKRAMKKFNVGYSLEQHRAVQRAVCGAIFTDWPSYLSDFAKSLGIEDNWDNKIRLAHINYSELERAITGIPEGMLEILSGLKGEGYKLATVSNCYPPTREFLDQTRISDIMDFMLLSYENGITKQSPEIYDKVLENLRVSPENAIMIGDSLGSDIKRAGGRGIAGIWIFDPSEKPDVDKPKLNRTDKYDFYAISNLKEVPACVEDYFEDV